MDIFNKNTYYYELPEELIAQEPVEPRDASRLLVYDRNNKSIEHKIFRDVIDYMDSGDILVVNNTKVLPARMFGVKEETNAKIEILLQKRIDLKTWEVLMRPGKRCKIGTIISISDELKCKVLSDTDFGGKIVEFIYEGTFEEILLKVGSTPLPQYIKKECKDPNRYQTVYAKQEGSSAAPTAGLHFTPELLSKIKDKGIKVVEVLLHVGLGTFRPVKVDNILEHHMHTEHYEVSEYACLLINKAKQEGKKVSCQ